MKVFINPGHAIGLDPGAVNNNYNVTEAEIAADVGAMATEYLREAGVDVMIMQSDNLCGEDGYSAYYSVCETANRWKADLFVSVHCNAASSLAQGAETFAYNQFSKGNQLAYRIQSQIINSLDVLDRGVKYANFIVLNKTDMPAVLVEMGFITNEHDVQLLMNKQDDYARAIARGITDYIREA